MPPNLFNDLASLTNLVGHGWSVSSHAAYACTARAAYVTYEMLYQGSCMGCPYDS